MLILCLYLFVYKLIITIEILFYWYIYFLITFEILIIIESKLTISKIHNPFIKNKKPTFIKIFSNKKYNFLSYII